MLSLAPPPPQEDEALDALRILAAALKRANLKHLNISDNALGEKGVRALADAFQHQVGPGCVGFRYSGVF